MFILFDTTFGTICYLNENKHVSIANLFFRIIVGNDDDDDDNLPLLWLKIQETKLRYDEEILR
jgi:hypothetical protein